MGQFVKVLTSKMFIEYVVLVSIDAPLSLLTIAKVSIARIRLSAIRVRFPLCGI